MFPRGILSAGDLGDFNKTFEREYVVFHLDRLQGDTKAPSEFFGATRVQLYRRCHRLGVKLRERRRRACSGS